MADGRGTRMILKIFIVLTQYKFYNNDIGLEIIQLPQDSNRNYVPIWKLQTNLLTVLA